MVSQDNPSIDSDVKAQLERLVLRRRVPVGQPASECQAGIIVAVNPPLNASSPAAWTVTVRPFSGTSDWRTSLAPLCDPADLEQLFRKYFEGNEG